AAEDSLDELARERIGVESQAGDAVLERGHQHRRPRELRLRGEERAEALRDAVPVRMEAQVRGGDAPAGFADREVEEGGERLPRGRGEPVRVSPAGVEQGEVARALPLG